MNAERGVLLLATVGAMLAGSPAAAQRFEIAGDGAAFYNIAGEVRVEAGSGSRVVVEVTPQGEDAGQLHVAAVRVGGHDVVRVEYPSDHVVYGVLGRSSNTTVRVRRDGSFGGGAGARSIRITGSGPGTRAWADTRVLVPAGLSVAVHLGAGSVDVSNVNGQVTVRTSAAAVSSRATQGTLDVDVGSGSLDVRDVQGTLRLQTGSGAVRVAQLDVDRADIGTGSGSVTGSNLSARTLNVDVGSGDVRLANVRATNAMVDTGSGSVDLDLRTDADNVRVDTGSGSIALALPADFGANAVIDTGSGGIRVDVPMTKQHSRGDHVEGRIGDGHGRLRLDSGSGSIRVRGQ